MRAIRARDEPPGPHDPHGTVIAALRNASSAFEPVWRETVADWTPEGVPQYLAVGAFAFHLVGQINARATGEFPAVFACIEELLGSDDPGVRYLVTWGLIEDINMPASYRVGPEQRELRSWFGPRTAEAWREVMGR